MSRDELTGEINYRKVLRTFITPDQDILELNILASDGKIENFKVTGYHPFYEKAKGWTEADELLSGDEVFTSTGGWLRVAGGTWLSEPQTVYNFEVEEFHAYFVGKIGILVHNSCAKNVSKLQNGMKLKTDKALDAAEEFLGEGYKDMGKGRFVSKDGLKQVRMGDADILGEHGGGSHMNFETLKPNPAKPGKNMIESNLHIYLEE